MTLTTLARVQAEKKGTEAGKAIGTDQQIMSYIRTVSSRIQGFGFEFEPYYQVRDISGTGSNIDSNLATLHLADPLLEPLTLSVNGISVAYGTDILPYPNDNQTPIWALRIAKPRSGPLRSWYPYNLGNCDQFIENISLGGFWGMRTDYPTLGFFDSGATCPALTASQAVFAAASTNGPDLYNRLPLFSPGNLLRIDNELLEVMAVAVPDASHVTLTVRRGLRGTVAVTHNLGAPILIFEPEEDIVGCATRQAALLLARQAAFEVITTGPNGVSISYPSDLLAEVRATVQRFIYMGQRS